MARTVLERPGHASEPIHGRPDRHRRPDGERQIGARAAPGGSHGRHDHQCRQHAALPRPAHPDRAAHARGRSARPASAVRRARSPRTRPRPAAGSSWPGAAIGEALAEGGRRSWSAAPASICMPCCTASRRSRRSRRRSGPRRGRGSRRSAARRSTPSSPQRDPAMAARLRPTDRQRLMRAYEVVVGTGRSLAAWQEAPPCASSCRSRVSSASR